MDTDVDRYKYRYYIDRDDIERYRHRFEIDRNIGKEIHIMLDFFLFINFSKLS